MLKSLIKKLLPDNIWRYLRRIWVLRRRKSREPQMIWGYQNASGTWQDRTRISDTAFIYHPEKVFIADNVFVWHYTILDGTGGLEIGEGTQIGSWVGIFTHSSHISIRLLGNHYQDLPEEEKPGFKVASVKIMKYVFIASGAMILHGVTIGEGALISAGSLVKNDVGPFEIVSGNPAKVVGDTRKLDKSYLKDPQLEAWYKEWQES